MVLIISWTDFRKRGRKSGWGQACSKTSEKGRRVEERVVPIPQVPPEASSVESLLRFTSLPLSLEPQPH